MLKTTLHFLFPTMFLAGLGFGPIQGRMGPSDVSAAEPDAPATKTFTYKTIKEGPLEVVVHYPPGWKETDHRPGIVFFFNDRTTG